MKLSPELQVEFFKIMKHVRAFINRSVAQTQCRERERPVQTKGTKAQ